MLNITILEGRIANDLKLEETEKGIKMCKFSLAHTDKINGKKITYYANIVAWRNFAETIVKYLKKGDLVIFTMKFTSRTYKRADHEGIKFYNVEFIVKDITFLPNKDSEDGTKSEKVRISAPDGEAFASVEDTGIEIGSDELPF